MSPKDRARVVVGMSGGVDSSVAAALLVEQGYDVTGMMLRLWSEDGTELANRCCTPQAMALARRVAAYLEIPFYALDVREVFRRRIVQYFLDGYAQGETPNPCLMCNRHIRFGALLDHARALGADSLATGHYARLEKSGENIALLRAVDRSKDQSYVLGALRKAQLARALFPIGEYTKEEVRELARRFGLPTAERPDSQDLCFLAGGDYRDFLARHIPDSLQPGPILDPGGQQLGAHRGLAAYTIGQRKGLGLSSPQPLYVIDKQPETNSLIVGPKEGLGSGRLTARQAHWLLDEPPRAGLQATVQVRYHAAEHAATVSPLPGEAFEAVFERPLHGATPGQAAVVYTGEQLAAFGIIETAGKERS